MDDRSVPRWADDCTRQHGLHWIPLGAEKKRELEAKLILGSYFKGWTFAENLIAEKNVKHAPFEFGYAVGVSRPLALSARPDRCNFCPENFQAGVEIYGGLGTHEHFGLQATSHYFAPTVAWTLASGPRFTVSPTFGITETSARFLQAAVARSRTEALRTKAASLFTAHLRYLETDGAQRVRTGRVRKRRRSAAGYQRMKDIVDYNSASELHLRLNGSI
jgi:hypothetical protein